MPPSSDLRRIRWRLNALLGTGELRPDRDYPLQIERTADVASYAETLLTLSKELEHTAESERGERWHGMSAFRPAEPPCSETDAEPHRCGADPDNPGALRPGLVSGLGAALAALVSFPRAS